MPGHQAYGLMTHGAKGAKDRSISPVFSNPYQDFRCILRVRFPLAIFCRHAVKVPGQSDKGALADQSKSGFYRQEAARIIGVGRFLVPRNVVGKQLPGRRRNLTRPHPFDAVKIRRTGRGNQCDTQVR
ncbi:hypothetical protein AOQ73_14515 [Bradyrhizobium pachyrhizi]|nr:hypothetical protein AOQ73_14515 [Bradyrhizobium pachyrhizi]